ncbi:MAG: hypothetical protein HN417_08970 [Desulfobacula sp.]|nr:hypothetical protein [Desulfobacula sp.]
MAAQQKGRDDLKKHFQSGAIPEEQHFADMIDSSINCKDDKLTKPEADKPLRIKPHGEAENLLDFGSDADDVKWRLSQKSGNTKGLNFSAIEQKTGKQESKLFIDKGTGQIGVGTDKPESTLHVQGDIKVTGNIYSPESLKREAEEKKRLEEQQKLEEQRRLEQQKFLEEQKKTFTGNILPDAYPFIYARMRRYGNTGAGGGYAWTSEIKLYNNEKQAGDWLFKNIIQGHTEKAQYDTYVIPPSLYFINKLGSFIKSDSWVEFGKGANQYHYPCYDIILMFIKNTTDLAIGSKFSRYYSSNDNNGDYNKSSAYVGTPDKTNTRIINPKPDDIIYISWKAVHNYKSGSSGTSASFDVSIPADTTIALAFYSSAFLYSDTHAHYGFLMATGICDFAKFLTEGLEVDKERTMKALQAVTPKVNEIWS